MAPLSFGTGLYSHLELVDVLRDRVQNARSEPAIVFVEGDAGIGKTTLLREVQRREAHAHFCTGEFQSNGAARPLGGWTSALIGLANIVLTSRSGELEAWRARFLGQLGEWAPMIGALAPEWQAILRCPAPSVADPLHSVNRLALAIRRLIGCYAEDDAPVVVMLDDVQWADDASLRLLELVLTAPDPLNLLVIAAMRGDDAEAAAVRSLQDRLRAGATDITTLHVEPWDEHDVAGFVADSFGHRVDDERELASLIVGKTHGNPFFVRELIRVLVQQQALWFHPEVSRWRWDRHALCGLPVTDNVVSFLSHRIEGLPAAVTDALRTCACLGRVVNLTEFRLVHKHQPAAAQLALERAVTEGLMVRRDARRQDSGAADKLAAGARPETTYEFVHDRVLEAARALSARDDRAAIHLRIARALACDLRGDGDEERAYKIATHVNRARELLVDRPDRTWGVEANLKAGRLAKARGAFSQALELLQVGLELLGEHSHAHDHRAAWRDQFALTLALYEETAEVALLNGQLGLMTRLCDAILARVESPVKKVLAYEIRICGLKAEKRYAAAVDVALEILGELGVELPARPTRLRLVLGYLATKRRVFAGPLSRLASAPIMEDPRIKAAGRIIQSVYPAAYLGRPHLFPFLVFRHVDDSLSHGCEEYSSVTYTALGVVLAATGRFDAAVELGDVGLALLRRFRADRLKARTFMAYYSFIFPWCNHIRDTLAYYREGLDAGLAHGDFEYASYIMTLDSLARLHSGDSLVDVSSALERYGAKLRSLGQERSILLQNMLCQMVLALRNGPEQENPLSGPLYDEGAELPRCLDPLDENLVFHNHLAKLTLCLFLGDPRSAVEAARHGRKHLANGAFAHYLAAVFMTYESLAHLAMARGKRRIGSTLRLVRRNQRMLKRWSERAPMNFLHKYHLVEAERCRVLGHGERAAEHFERAIELSQTHGFVHETGLAQQYAAEFYFERGMERLGRQYLRDCYVSFRRWGAKALIQRIRSAHAQHFAMLATSVPGFDRDRVLRIGERMNFLMLLQSSQAISGEILLPRLLERLLQSILEHSGAQRALLVLEKRGQLHVEAEADVDQEGVKIIGQEPVEDTDRLCAAIVRYTARMMTPVVLADAARAGMFVDEPYVQDRKPRSLLCTPISYHGKLIGLIYLENHRVSHVFTRSRLEVVSLLATQAAISITNARFHTLELEAQQAKINPHFLFNALSSIADLAVRDGAKAETAIVQLASLYRYILTNSTKQLVTLDQELEIVRSYLTLEKLRYGTKLSYSVTTKGDVSQVQLPGLLIQPLVENSIRYGVAPRLTPGTVSVHAAVHGDRCSIVVHDDGDGSSHVASGTGFGLRSVQERLELAYGKEFTFSISRNDGYRVEIEIPAMA
ncbi:MAG TPA: AAA family ATPase [Kofleriaceae bacterium]|nr:AAA family ATPase [Kofleriaceae bacterium]